LLILKEKDIDMIQKYGYNSPMSELAWLVSTNELKGGFYAYN